MVRLRRGLWSTPWGLEITTLPHCNSKIERDKFQVLWSLILRAPILLCLVFCWCKISIAIMSFRPFFRSLWLWYMKGYGYLPLKSNTDPYDGGFWCKLMASPHYLNLTRTTKMGTKICGSFQIILVIILQLWDEEHSITASQLRFLWENNWLTASKNQQYFWLQQSLQSHHWACSLPNQRPVLRVHMI